MIRGRKMRSILVAAFLLCVVPALQAADNENPFRNTNVGDWVEYKMTGPNMEGKTKMTVVAKDNKELTYQVAGTFSYMGNEMVAPIQTQKIDLTKPYDPIVAANLKEKGVKVEKQSEGKEKIKFGNKVYDTTWTKSKSTVNVNGVGVVSNTKMWFTKSVPLSGMVRMETTTSGLTTKLDLIGSSSK